MSEPITVPHAASLLIRLRLRRALNLFDAIYRYRFRGAGRKATARTSPTMVLISGLVVLVMLGSFTHLAYQCMTNIQDVLGTVRSADDDAPVPAGRDSTVERLPSRASLHRLPDATGTVLPAGVL